jgi:hypothetical protein
VVLHALGAMIGLRVAKHVVSATDSPASTTIVVLAIMLPALIYVFLASLWTLKMVRAAMPR